MSTFLTFISLVIVAIFCMFIVWRSLREDYKESQIFSFLFMVAIGALLGYFASGFLLPELRFWMTIGFGAIFGMLRARRLSMHFFEVTEAITPAFLIYLLFLEILIITKNFSFNFLLLVEPVIITLSLVVFYLLANNYRKFLWYPSGKVGFASLGALSLFFFIRGLFPLIAKFAFPILVFNFSTFDIILGMVLTLATLVTLYIRSGRSIREDIKILGYKDIKR